MLIGKVVTLFNSRKFSKIKSFTATTFPPKRDALYEWYYFGFFFRELNNAPTFPILNNGRNCINDWNVRPIHGSVWNDIPKSRLLKNGNRYAILLIIPEFICSTCNAASGMQSLLMCAYKSSVVSSLETLSISPALTITYIKLVLDC